MSAGIENSNVTNDTTRLRRSARRSVSLLPSSASSGPLSPFSSAAKAARKGSLSPEGGGGPQDLQSDPLDPRFHTHTSNTGSVLRIGDRDSNIFDQNAKLTTKMR